MSYFTDTEIDEIIGAVEESMQNAANLAKSADFSNDEDIGDGPEMGGSEDMGGEEALSQAATEKAPQEAMGGEEAAQEMTEEAPEEAMGEAPEEAPQEMGSEDLGEESLEEDDGELSDEELHQIYGSMEPSDLERHYMIIRGMLRDSYAKMEKSEAGNSESLSKKEEYEAKIQELTKNQKEMESSLAAAFKAMELMAKPERKAVTSEVQVLGKTESDVTSSPAKEEIDFSSLSKSEIVSKINEKVKDPKLTKSDRDLINQYLLHGEDKEQVFNLLRSN